MSVDSLPALSAQIMTRIDLLGDYMREQKLSTSVLMTIRPVSRLDERKKEVPGILVSTENNAGIEDVIAALKDVKVDNVESLAKNSTKITAKYPGLIVVKGDVQRLKELINDINDAKANFAVAMRGVSANKNQRFEQVHGKIPGLISLQSTRKIQLVEQTLKKVSFAWRMNIIQRRMKSQDLITQLKNRLATIHKSPATADMVNAIHIEQALDRLHNLVLKPGEELRLSRTNNFPVPVAHLFSHRPADVPRGSSKYADLDYQVIKASMPIFAAGIEVNCQALENWTAPTQKSAPTRRLTLEYSELVPGGDLGIYIVRSAK